MEETVILKLLLYIPSIFHIILTAFWQGGGQFSCIIFWCEYFQLDFLRWQFHCWMFWDDIFCMIFWGKKLFFFNLFLHSWVLRETARWILRGDNSSLEFANEFYSCWMITWSVILNGKDIPKCSTGVILIKLSGSEAQVHNMT